MILFFQVIKLLTKKAMTVLSTLTAGLENVEFKLQNVNS